MFPPTGHFFWLIEVIATNSGRGHHANMGQNVKLTVPMPANLAKLRFPKALNARMHHLLDEQSRKGKLPSTAKEEVEALAELASMLSTLRLGAQVRAPKA